MAKGTLYVCDTTALIDVYQHFPKKFRKLKTVVAEERFKIPEGVARELQRSTDKLGKTIGEWAEKFRRFVVSIQHNQRLMNGFPRIDRTYGDKVTVGGKEYPGFWHSPAGRKAADAQVVAVGKVLGCIVVSDDRSVRLACLLENVECIGWTEFARRTGIMIREIQLDLELK